MKEYILVVQWGKGEYLVYAFLGSSFQWVLWIPPSKQTNKNSWADQVAYIKLLVTGSVMNTSDILINIVF